MMSRQLSQRRSGFILVYCLLVVALAGILLARMATKSFAQLNDARAAAESMKRRWAILSSREALLANPEQLFELDQEAGSDLDSLSLYDQDERNPRGVVEHELLLSGFRVRVVLSDENSKLNLNQVARWSGSSAIRRVVQDSLPSSSTMRVRPTAPQDIRNWSDLFDLSRKDDDDPLDQLRIGSSLFTCWGDGRINVLRAPEAVTRQAARWHLTTRETERFVESLNADSFANLQNAIQSLGLRESVATDLSQTFVESSSSYSLWIVVESNTRSWHNLFVLESGKDTPEGTDEDAGVQNKETSQRHSFVW